MRVSVSGDNFSNRALAVSLCTNSAISAGFIAVLVGYASAWVIVYQAAIAAGASLQSTFKQPDYRDAALFTFLVTASGVSFFNIASAFWGITIGLGTLAISRIARA